MNHPEGPSRRSFALADHMLDAAATYSLRDGRFHYINAAAERIFGVDREAMLADPRIVNRLVVEEDRPAFAAFLQQSDSEGAASAEFRIRRPDGQLRWLAARAFPVDGSGEPMRAAICEDITERKSIEQALRESEQRFRLVAENIEEVFWIFSPDGTHIHYVSPAYERIWGQPAEELYASPFRWMQAVHPEDQLKVLDAITRHQAERPLETQFRIVRGSGEVCHIRHRSAPIRDAAGNVVQVVGMTEDVTEQKRLERQAEESARAQRDALVREVHHRIKNNLQGVTGMLRNYANQHPEVVGVINEAIAQVQAVAIIYGLQGRPGVVRVELVDLLKEVLSGIGQLMHAGIEFRDESQSLGYKVVVSELEAVPVALVLNEVIFNALKHGNTRLTPVIDLRIDIARERVVLSVTNGGHLPDRRKRPEQGSGSGLQLIRSLLPRRGARFELANGVEGVIARLTLEPPIVTLKC